MPRSISPFQLSSSRLSALRSGAALGLIGLLAACAGTPNSSGPQLPVSQEAATYRAHAKSYYAPQARQTTHGGHIFVRLQNASMYRIRGSGQS